MTIQADLRPIGPDDTTVIAPAKSKLPRWPYLLLLILVVAGAGYYFVHGYQWRHSLSNAANPVAAQTSFVFPVSSAGTHASFVATTGNSMYALDPIARTISVYRKGSGAEGWYHGTTSTIDVPLVPAHENAVAQPLVGLATTSGGVLYTVDVANHLVVRIDAHGRVDTGWASTGIGVPVGVVVTKSGNVDVLSVETHYPSGLLTSITRITAAGHATPHWALLPGMGSAIAASTIFDNVYVGHAGSTGPDRNWIDVVKPDGSLWTTPITVPATKTLGNRTYTYDPAGVRPYGVDGPGQYIAEYDGVVYVRYDAAGSVLAALFDAGTTASGANGDFRHLVYQSGAPAQIVAVTPSQVSNTSIPVLGITTQHQFAAFRHAGSGF
jgi:hypothetical protein